MKKIILILVLISTLLIGCNIMPIDNFHNSIVVSKKTNKFGYFVEIKYLKHYEQYNRKEDQWLYRFEEVQVHKYDYDRVNIGDTLK